MLSILIVNWNTRDLLRSCLQSIKKHEPKTEYEIVVVDNASTDGSASMVREEFPELTLIANDRNLGYARANNQAFEVAQGRWLLTLNPDTEFFDGSLDKAVATLEEKPGFGSLGAKLIGEDGSVQQSVRGFPTILGILGDMTGLGRVFLKTKLGSYRLSAFDYTREQPAPQPMGTFLLFRREALEAVGDPAKPFDESFPIFFNEVDLLYRLEQAGWPCLYCPHVLVKHLGGQSTRQVRKSMIWESHRSLVRFLRKHTRGAGRIALPLITAAAYVGAFVRTKGHHVGFRP